MTTTSFDRLATESASTKRATVVDGKRGVPAVHVATLACTPLDPLGGDEGIRLREVLETPHELLQTFVAGETDVREGDVLVVDGKDYPVRVVANWAGRVTHKRLAVEDLKL